jgi:hypothetical protein
VIGSKRVAFGLTTQIVCLSRSLRWVRGLRSQWARFGLPITADLVWWFGCSWSMRGVLGVSGMWSAQTLRLKSYGSIGFGRTSRLL